MGKFSILLSKSFVCDYTTVLVSMLSFQLKLCHQIVDGFDCQLSWII